MLNLGLRSAVSLLLQRVSPQIMSSLFKQSKNPIFEVELAPILISRDHWQTLLRGAQLVCCLDNDGVRHTCISTPTLIQQIPGLQ